MKLDDLPPDVKWKRFHGAMRALLPRPPDELRPPKFDNLAGTPAIRKQNIEFARLRVKSIYRAAASLPILLLVGPLIYKRCMFGIQEKRKMTG